MLNEILIPVPKSDEQNRICTLIDAKKQLIKETTDHLVILRLTKTGLMQDLLTGKVRVTDLLNHQPTLT
jgi:type I restriction enzyme, S subunit